MREKKKQNKQQINGERREQKIAENVRFSYLDQTQYYLHKTSFILKLH